MAEREHKKSHAGRNTAIAVVALAALLGGGRYGLGIGRGGDGALTGAGGGTQPETVQTTAAPAAEVTAAPEAEPLPADDGVLEITVREDTLLYEGAETDLSALKDALLRDYSEGMTVKLIDDHAVKAAYDEAAALLDSLGIEAAH